MGGRGGMSAPGPGYAGVSPAMLRTPPVKMATPDLACGQPDPPPEVLIGHFLIL